MTAATCELSEATARPSRGSPCVLASVFSVWFCPASVSRGVGLSQLPDPRKEQPSSSEEAVISGIPGSEQACRGAGGTGVCF